MSFRQTLPLLVQKSRSKSSKQWISRQLRDPYVKKRLLDPFAYRSRSAFKLLEINEQMGGFLDQSDVRTIVDLGAAPGGWSQVVAGTFGSDLKDGLALHASSTKENDDFEAAVTVSREFQEKAVSFRLSKGKSKRDADHLGPCGRGTIVAVDLLPIEPIPGVHIVHGDFLFDSTTEHIRRLLEAKHDSADGTADVILSDMAANVSGNTARDTQSSLEICEAVFEFAKSNLRSADVIGRRKGGVLLVKFFAHPLLDQFRKEKLEPNFNYVRYVKPDSSRTTSREGYFLCQGWVPSGG